MKEAAGSLGGQEEMMHEVEERVQPSGAFAEVACAWWTRRTPPRFRGPERTFGALLGR
ncbi:MAG TPA: hypothetical protein VGV36_06960 [Solirubrobacteraceae bacterium]|nr:hypothetical protein [Solirubrobacteraceae bacterium]